MANGGTTRRVLDYSEWSGTESHHIERVETNELLESYPFYRFINNLDVSIDIDISVTDAKDDARERMESPDFYIGSNIIGWPPLGGHPGTQETQDTITISSGSIDSYAMITNYDIIEVKVTPASTPSSGQFILIDMR